MTFLTFPLLVGGLCAAVLPIIIHIVMRGTPRKVEFPALRLLKSLMIVHAQKYRLKHWLLLFLRVMLLAGLGLALARPTIKLADWFPSLATSTGRDARGSIISTLASSLTSQDAPVAAIIVIDTSPRMEYRAANLTALDQAKTLAKWIIENLPQTSQVAILTGRGDTDFFQLDTHAALKRIDSLSIDYAARNVIDSAQRGVKLLQDESLPVDMAHEFYILSDLTEPGWKTTEAAEKFTEQLAEKSASDAAIFVIDVGQVSTHNFGITEANFESAVVAPQTGRVGIDVEVAHLGAGGNTTLELFVRQHNQDKTADERRGSRHLEFPAGDARQRVSFTLANFVTPGFYHATLKLTSRDALEVDDQRFFTFAVRAPREILLVANEPVRRRATYLREALAMSAGITTREISFVDFERTLLRDEKSDAIFLLDPPPLTAATWNTLSQLVTQGKGLGVFLGRAALPISAFQIPEATQLFGATPIRQARATESPLWLVSEQENSPLLAPLQRLGIEAVPWNASPIFRYWELNNLAPTATIEFRFSDRRAAIVTQKRGRGATLLMTTPLSDDPNDEAWNLLPVGEAAWIFVMLAEGIGDFLTGGSENEVNYLSGDRVVLRPRDEKLPNVVWCKSPNEENANSEETRIPVDIERREIVLTETKSLGHYQLRSAGAQSFQAALSVNVPKSQIASLKRIDSTTLDATFGAGKYRLATTPAEIEIGIARRRVGQELFTLIILFVTFLFAAEWLAANRFYA